MTTQTPQQLADEKAMEIAKSLGLDLKRYSLEQTQEAISTHLFPLYECVEALRKVNTGHTDKCRAMFGGKCNCGYDAANNALANLTKPTTKEEGEEK